MTMSEKAAAAIDEFGRSRGVTNGQFEILKGLFEASPLLAEKLGEVMQSGHVRFVLKSDPQQQDGYAGKHRELYLDPQMLSKSDGRDDHFKRIGFLGYEMQRVLHHKEQTRSLDRIRDKAGKISVSGSRDRSQDSMGALGRIKAGVKKAVKHRGGERNYTGLVREYMDTERSYQAMAEIACWNTVVSALHKESGHPAEGVPVTDLAHSRWYNPFKVGGMLPDNFKYAGNVVHDDQLYVAASAQKIKAVAQNVEAGEHAVNSAFSNRGHLGSTHGPHLYAAELVHHIAACELRHHGAQERGDLSTHVRIDAAALGLSPDTLVEHAGNCLARMRYVDKSDGTAKCLEFNPPARVAGNDPLKLNEDGHPDCALYCQTLDKVRALECDLSADSRENLAAALMVKAVEGGVRIDAIEIHDTKVYAVQDPGRIRKEYVEMDLARAATTLFDASCTQWDEQMRERQQAALGDSQADRALPQAQPSAASHRPWDAVIQEMKQVNSRKF